MYCNCCSVKGISNSLYSELFRDIQHLIKTIYYLAPWLSLSGIDWDQAYLSPSALTLGAYSDYNETINIVVIHKKLITTLSDSEDKDSFYHDISVQVEMAYLNGDSVIMEISMQNWGMM